MSNQDKMDPMIEQKFAEADKKLKGYVGGLMEIVEKSSHVPEDRILLAGAMISVAKMMYIETAGPEQGNWFFDHNIRDLVPLVKPTIH
jgi:hypothetical protein